MLTDYDAIADRYQRAKRQPWRAAIEAYTLLDLAGDLAGQAVVDLACGEGFYTRRLRDAGAARAVGVDRSAGMIDLARAQEAEQPLGIEYRVGDAADVGPEEAGSFDLAVAAYLLNYARDRAELAAMCRGIARRLRPGGRFVTANTNPALDFGSAPSYRPYGFEVAAAGPLVEGTPIVWTFHLDDGPVRVENYHLPISAHDEALAAAGFREVRWHPPRLSREAEADGRDAWETFLAAPPVIFLEARL